MIYDCFLYYDEDMLLELRLNTLYDYVDKFVIVESLYTFKGIRREKNQFDIENFISFREKKFINIAFSQIARMLKLVVLIRGKTKQPHAIPL